MNLSIGGYQGEASVHTRAMRDFISDLKNRSSFDIDVTFHPNITDQGRAAADLLSMVASGDLDLCYFSSSYLASEIAALNAFEMPFSLASREEFYKLLDGPAGEQARHETARHSPYVILALWDNGVRHISNGKRELRTPRDCEGLTIRTLDNAFHQTVFQALGFRPRTIDVRDLAREVRDGTIDAQENPLTNIVNFGLHETHRFVTLSAHFFGVALMLCNRQAFEARPAELQRDLMLAAEAATRAQRAYAAAEDANCMSILEAAGVLVSTLTPAERSAFKDKVAGLEP
jgi:C4-dicarboxylate-binding protein DctP